MGECLLIESLACLSFGLFGGTIQVDWAFKTEIQMPQLAARGSTHHQDGSSQLAAATSYTLYQYVTRYEDRKSISCAHCAEET